MSPFRQTLQRLFRRPRQPESGPVRLVRKRIYILPTYAGMLYAATLAAMLLCAINYQLALGHALVFLLFSLALVAMLHTHKNLQDIVLQTQENAPVFAGETASFRLLVSSPDSPRPALEWQCPVGVRPEETHILHLDGEAALLHLPLPAPRRGWLTLPPLSVATRYPLGLFRAWSTPWLDNRCLVYPQPLFSPLPPGVASGRGDSGSGEAGEEDFIGLRERQSSDPLRHVAWKTLARHDGRGPLLVKRFGGGAQEELWLEWERLETLGDDVETRLSILAGWIVDAEGNGFDYGLSLPGTRLPPARGAAHFHRCLKALALYPTNYPAGAE